MKIFLTGGTGSVGTAAVERLVNHGHGVTVIGRTAGIEIPGATYRRCDLGDYDRLEELMRGHDAVVHLAAIPHPIGVPGREVFRANDQGTFNVYEAAAENGIRRVVGASSINAIGYFYGDRSFPLPYLPIDEQSPSLATDAYSFSKQVMEQIGRYFWERDRISGALLRLPHVVPHARALEIAAEQSRSPLIDEILAMPEPDRTARVRRLHDEYDRYRRANRLDKVERFGPREHDPERLSEEELHLLHQTVNFFAYVDERDSAHAIELAVTVDLQGCHPLFINASRNSAGLTVAEAALLYPPPPPEPRVQRTGDTCLCSIEAARELLGFEPHW